MSSLKSELYELFTTLRTFSDPMAEKGTTRLAYSEQDELAHKWLIEKMKEKGLSVRTDSMGNVFARIEGQSPNLPVVATGSHLDTVPNGGSYDGIIGGISGLTALLNLKDKPLKRGIELIIFRAEESSRFGCSCLGSKALSGKINIDQWMTNRDREGKNCFDAIIERGYASEQPHSHQDYALPENYLNAFVELHIEQGKVLESEDKEIGIVYGIAAPTRFEITVNGQADHSGATPMNQRSDALVATTEIIKAIHLSGCRESIYSTVATVGKLDVFPNSMNVIPGKVIFYVDIRGVDQESIARVEHQLMESIAFSQSFYQCEIQVREISREAPVTLNKEVCQLIQSICDERAIRSMPMISGAGHDAMYMATLCKTAMIFIPSYQGISHHPDEFSEWQDVERSAEILSETLYRLANEV